MTAPPPTVPDLTTVWRVTDHTGPVNYNERRVDGHKLIRSVRVAHLVRRDHTLCGRDATRITWDAAVPDPGPDVTACAICLTVQDGHLTYRDMLAAADITYRQLDHWCRKGWLHPDNPLSGSGSLRTFPPDELPVAVEMGRLVRAGVQASVAATLARGPGNLDVAWAAGRGECA